MNDHEKPTLNWSADAALAPSTRRIDPWGWAVASAIAGGVAASAVLTASWRPADWAPLPPGPLIAHVGYWAKSVIHCAFPLAFDQDARLYKAFLGKLSTGQIAGMAARLALAACAAVAPGALLAKSFLRPRDGLIFLRGSTRFSGQQAVDALRAALSARVERRPDHDIAAGISYSSDLWTRHVLVVGGVGSGKSTAIKPLIEKIVGADEQMLLFDPKGEFTSGFAKPEIIAPWDDRSLAWDVARDLRNVLDMRRFAATMIRESSDPMWSNASRQLLVGILIYLKGTRGFEWGWVELKELVALPQSQLLPIMMEWHPEAVRAVEKATVTTAGILINLAAFCSSIFDLAQAWGEAPVERRVSFIEWTAGRSPHRQIILQGHGAYGELTRSYVEGIVGIVSAIVNSVEMRDDPNRKLWFVADEFAQMGKVPVRALFEVGRSRGVRCVVACQDFAQLEEIHGVQMVKALVAMCGTILAGQVMQGETAEQLCKTFGSREVERANVSSQGGKGGASTLSYAREDVPLYKPSELSSRLGLTPKGDGVVLVLFTGGSAYEIFWPHYRMRDAREPHVPAPWTMGVPGRDGKIIMACGADRAKRAPTMARSDLASLMHSDPSQVELARSGAVASLDASEVDDLGDSLQPSALSEVQNFRHGADEALARRKQFSSQPFDAGGLAVSGLPAVQHADKAMSYGAMADQKILLSLLCAEFNEKPTQGVAPVEAGVVAVETVVNRVDILGDADIDVSNQKTAHDHAALSLDQQCFHCRAANGSAHAITTFAESAGAPPLSADIEQGDAVSPDIAGAQTIVAPQRSNFKAPINDTVAKFAQASEDGDGQAWRIGEVAAAGGSKMTDAGQAGEPGESLLSAEDLEALQDDLWGLDVEHSPAPATPDPLNDSISEHVAAHTFGGEIGAGLALLHLADALSERRAKQALLANANANANSSAKAGCSAPWSRGVVGPVPQTAARDRGKPGDGPSRLG